MDTKKNNSRGLFLLLFLRFVNKKNKHATRKHQSTDQSQQRRQTAHRMGTNQKSMAVILPAKRRRRDKTTHILSRNQSNTQTSKKQKSSKIRRITWSCSYTAKIIHIICSNIWQNKILQDEWIKSIIITLPKSGYTTKCNNHCTISLQVKSRK